MKKGDTIVEVLVGLFIFSTVIATSIMLFTSMVSFYNADNVYIVFEAKCQDIDHYYDHFGSEWKKYYFTDLPEGSFEENINKGLTKYYFNKSFKYTNKEEAAYVMIITNEMVLDVKLIENGKETEKYVIKGLEYGVSKYCSVLDSYKNQLCEQFVAEGIEKEAYFNDRIVKTYYYGVEYYDLEAVEFGGKQFYRKDSDNEYETENGNVFFKIEKIEKNDEGTTYKISYLDSTGCVKGVITYVDKPTQK